MISYAGNQKPHFICVDASRLGEYERILERIHTFISVLKSSFHVVVAVPVVDAEAGAPAADTKSIESSNAPRRVKIFILLTVDVTVDDGSWLLQCSRSKMNLVFRIESANYRFGSCVGGYLPMNART